MAAAIQPSMPYNPETLILFRQKLRKPCEANIFARGIRAIKIANHNGKITLVAAVAIHTGLTTYTLFSTYWELKGCVYSILEMHERGDIIGRELGDVGGWAALAVVIDTFGWILTTQALIGEAQFWGLKNDSEKSLKKHVLPPKKSYEAILNEYNKRNSTVFSYKPVVTRILLALEKVSMQPDESSQSMRSIWAMDTELKPIYQEIEAEYKAQCNVHKYFHRVLEGQKSINQKKGIWGTVTSIGMGFGVPLFLVAMNVCSVIGLYKLIQQVIVDGEDKPSYGHIGEWLSNIAQATALGAFFHCKFFLKPGDASIMENLIEKALAKVDDPELYLRLCDIGIQEQENRQYIGKGKDFANFKIRHEKDE